MVVGCKLFGSLSRFQAFIAEMMPGVSRSADHFVVVLQGPQNRYGRCHCHYGGKPDAGKQHAELPLPGNRKRGCSGLPNGREAR